VPDLLITPGSLLDRIRRKVRQLAGRPDPSPWVLYPHRPAAARGRIDFVIALDYMTMNGGMIDQLHRAMSRYGLSTLLVNRQNVDRVLRLARLGRIRPAVFLDLCSTRNDPYEQLLHTLADQGVHTLRDPSQTKWIVKASAHRLLQPHVPVPPTVVFAKEEADRDLTVAERELLGDRVAIKPSCGGAGRGVRLNVEPTLQNIADARAQDRSDDWLVQRMMPFVMLGDRIGYFRLYNVLGHLNVMWWSPSDHHYATFTWADLDRYRLWPLLGIAHRIAQITRMEYFSVEAAYTGEEGPHRLCLIDYVNDQCDMDAFNPGCPPPEWTAWVCERLALRTYQVKHRIAVEEQCSVTLAGAPPVALRDLPMDIDADLANRADAKIFGSERT